MAYILPTEIKIRYRGKQYGGKWIYQAPKTVELPIPYISRSEKVGEVLCNPCGVFPYADGIKLLELSGKDGPFVIEEEIYGDQPEEPEPEIEVGPESGIIVSNPTPPPAPRFQLSKKVLRRRNRRGNSGRPGVSRPFPKKKTETAAFPDNPQAAAEKQAPSPE